MSPDLTRGTPDAERNLLAMGLWLLACVLGPGWSVGLWVWAWLTDVDKVGVLGALCLLPVSLACHAVAFWLTGWARALRPGGPSTPIRWGFLTYYALVLSLVLVAYVTFEWAGRGFAYKALSVLGVGLFVTKTILASLLIAMSAVCAGHALSVAFAKWRLPEGTGGDGGESPPPSGGS